MVLSKKCQLCPEPKPLSEFNKRSESPDGLAYICKDCNKKASKKYQTENIQEINLKRKVYREENKDKVAASYRRWQLQNPEKANANARKWVEKNKEKSRKSKMRYVFANLEKFCAQEAKRRAAKLQRTPTWMTKELFEQIKNIYVQAKELQTTDGIERHVDHIVPLQGKNVSGLHVPWNLQILTATENLKKHNTF